MYPSRLSLNVIKYLVEEENADSKIDTGDTLLHLACKAGCFEEAKYWLGHCGLHMDAKNEDGMTPVHLAAKKGHLEIVQWLI
jgi:ankyrin repeat protein